VFGRIAGASAARAGRTGSAATGRAAAGTSRSTDTKE
jgi:hypothetical protein